MRTYIIQYSSDNKIQSEKISGICIITEKDRRAVIKTFHSEFEDFKMNSIDEIKGKSGIIFDKTNVPLS